MGHNGLVVARLLRKFASRGEAPVCSTLQSRSQPSLLRLDVQVRAAATSPQRTQTQRGGGGGGGGAGRYDGRQPPQTARSPEQQGRDLSQLLRKDVLSQPHILPKVIVAAEKLPSTGVNQGLAEWLEQASKDVQALEDPLLAGGPIGLLTTALGARRLGLEQGRLLSSTVFSILAACVPRLEDGALGMLSFQMLTQRVGESSVWQAIFETVQNRPQIDKNEAVRLLNNLRQARILGHRHDQVLAHLAQQLIRPPLANEPPLDSERLVQALASLTRLQSHVEPKTLQVTLHKLLDQWQALQAKLGVDFEATPSAQLLSILVSLASMRNYTHTNLGPMLKGTNRWLEKKLRPQETPAADALQLEQAFIMVWAMKELTPTGLKEYTRLTQMILSRLRTSPDLEKYSALRLKQLSEVLLSARHALGEADTELEGRVADCLAKLLVKGHCPTDVLRRILTLWNQAGSVFWNTYPHLADAVMECVIKFTEDSQKVPLDDLALILDTLTKSCFAASNRYQAQRGVLLKAVLARTDSNSSLLTRPISLLESGEIPILPGLYTPESEEDAPQDTSQASEGKTETQTETETAAERRTGPVLPPAELAVELSKLCSQKGTDGEIVGVAQMLLSNLDELKPDDALPALKELLAACGKFRRIDDVACLSEVLERLADVVTTRAPALSAFTLIDLLKRFAELRQPHFFLFERSLAVLLAQHGSRGMSASQVLTILEAFAMTRMNLPQLSQLVRGFRTSAELDRMPTMQLIRLLGVTTSLNILERPQEDVHELVTRVLAETTDDKPLPIEGVATILSSVYLSGTVLPDSDLRRLLLWLARDFGPEELKEAEIAGFRLFFMSLMAKPDPFARDCLNRMLVDVQRFVRTLMQHESATANVPGSKMGNAFKNEVMKMCFANNVPCQVVPLGPAGSLDLQIGSIGYFLHGPETFFGPSVARTSLRMTPQEQRRCWLLQRLLSDTETRKRVQDFYPAARDWPDVREFRHLSWLTWYWADDSERRALLGIAPSGHSKPVAGAVGGGSAGER